MTSGEGRAKSLVVPAAVWLVIQLAALGVVAGHVPFAATKSFPRPADLLGFKVILPAQFVGSALCFPLLMGSFNSAAITIAGAVPFTIMAGFLTGDFTQERLIFTSGYVSAWLTGLGFWRMALRSPRAQAAGIAIAMLVVLAGPLAWYLRGEFQLQSDTVKWGEIGTWSPLLGAMRIAEPDPHARGPWTLIAAHVILGGIAGGLARIAFKRHSLKGLNPPKKGSHSPLPATAFPHQKRGSRTK